MSLDAVLESFLEQTENPANFLGISKKVTDDIKSNVKDIYDFSKNEETKANSKSTRKSLKKLIVQNFDFEQIWQQIELQNDDLIDTAVKDLSTLLVSKNQLIFKSINDELINDNDEVEDELVEGGVISEDDDSSSDDDKEHNKLRNASDDNSSDDSNCEDEEHEALSNDKTTTTQNHKGSVVDDDFFKLNEMEEFLRNEEKPKPTKDTKSDSDEDEDDDAEGSIDLFEEGSEESGEDEAKVARFKDYFVAREDDQPKRKTNKLLQELEGNDNSESEPEDEEDLINELKSTLELRQERLQRKIVDLEERAVSDKPWHLKGEVTAENRPQNSLLEEIVEFDLTSRPAPVITEQTSLQLEDIIRQRIKNKIFDSVEKISRPIETPLEYKKKLVLDQEKSKQSLANIYEKEFLEQQADLDKDKMDTDEVEPETHKEVKKLMKSLFTKLDALSNFHFTSTPAIPELKIVSNLPAVNMEEVAPVASSEAALLAPEEIRNKAKGDMIGKQEKTSTDKKRERRKKKLKQKIHSQRKAKIENDISKKNRVKA